MLHITHPANLGAGIDLKISEDQPIGLAIRAVADNVARRREELNLPNPLAPVIIRVWDAGYSMSTMQEHTVYPERA